MDKQETIEKKLEHLKNSLFNIAMSDGKINSDERNMLNALNYSIDLLEKTLDQAFEDGVIEDDEKKELTDLINKISDNAVTVAEFDEELTRDEQSLINLLKNTLIDINNNINEL